MYKNGESKKKKKKILAICLMLENSKCKAPEIDTY